MKLTSLVVAAAITPASLALAAAAPIGYSLSSASTLTSRSCLEPCKCVYHEEVSPLTGSFTLTEKTPGIVTTQYLVTGLSFAAVLEGRPLQIDGYGTYQVGSTFPYQHQLTLELTIDGSTQTYDSGWVTIDPSSLVPAIDIKITGRNWTCGEYDLRIVAAPDTAVCYANCDGSAVAPVLNVQDFACFLMKYAAGDPYANCDGSAQKPAINVADFSCFIAKYAAGCP